MPGRLGPSLLCAAAMAFLFLVDHAAAASVKIVALGASNTYGKGVGLNFAWPAKLEAKLRAKGYDVTVANAGINRDTASGMLARLGSAVPNGTQLVILGEAPLNDRRDNVDTAANAQAIAVQLKTRGIKLIVIPDMHGWANHHLQADGRHITEQGHDAVAARLLPLVIRAVRKE
jgi:acyl-CoA thioesterase I